MYRQLTRYFGHLRRRMACFRALVIVAFFSLQAYGVNACANAALRGPYGLDLSGISTISGSSKPFAEVARLAFDGEGSISGYSSVNFDGLLLGNPVTGRYAVGPDCSVSVDLQDDSGAYQHFAGNLDLSQDRVVLRQTDPGTGAQGKAEPIPATCDSADLQPQYTLTLSGTATPFAASGVPQKFSAKGVVDIASGTEFTLEQILKGHKITTTGTLSVDSDCTIHFGLELPVDSGRPVAMKLRGFLVDGGRGIFAIQTDPDAATSARFTATK